MNANFWEIKIERSQFKNISSTSQTRRPGQTWLRKLAVYFMPKMGQNLKVIRDSKDRLFSAQNDRICFVTFSGPYIFRSGPFTLRNDRMPFSRTVYCTIKFDFFQSGLGERSFEVWLELEIFEWSKRMLLRTWWWTFMNNFRDFLWFLNTQNIQS